MLFHKLTYMTKSDRTDRTDRTEPNGRYKMDINMWWTDFAILTMFYIKSIFIVNRIELTKIEVTRQEWVWKNAPDFHTTSLPASLGPLSVRPRLWPHYDQAALPYLGVSCRSRIFNWWIVYHWERVQLRYPWFFLCFDLSIHSCPYVLIQIGEL